MPPSPRSNYFDQFDTPKPDIWEQFSYPAPTAAPPHASPYAQSMRSANDLLPYCKYLFTDQPQGRYNVGFGVGLCVGIIDEIGKLSRAACRTN